MDLTGKWRYIENYGYGVAEGELYLKQKGQTLAGRIVFTDKVEGESSYMIQEFLKGELEGRRVRHHSFGVSDNLSVGSLVRAIGR